MNKKFRDHWMAPAFGFGQAMFLVVFFMKTMESFSGIKEKVTFGNFMIESQKFFHFSNFMPRLFDQFFTIHHVNLAPWKII